MNKFLHNNPNSLSICDKNNNCIHAMGKNAELIAIGVFLTLVMFGVARLIEATK